MAIDEKLIDQLLAQNGHGREDIIGETGLIKQLTKAILNDEARDVGVALLGDFLGSAVPEERSQGFGNVIGEAAEFKCGYCFSFVNDLDTLADRAGNRGLLGALGEYPHL